MILSTYRQKLMESSSHFGIALQTSIFCMNNLGFFFYLYTLTVLLHITIHSTLQKKKKKRSNMKQNKIIKNQSIISSGGLLTKNVNC